MAAFTLVSETQITQSPLKLLFEFLSDFKNFGSILPADKVENFRYSENECSFSIKGITPMTIRLAEKKPYDHILFTSEGLGKFSFRLKAVFEGDPAIPGQCRIELSGDLNPFILKMAESPLKGLVDTMSKRLSELQLSA